MTRPRPAWLLIAALSLPAGAAAPALLLAQEAGEERAPKEAGETQDAAARPAGETSIAEEPEATEGRAEPREARPRPAAQKQQGRPATTRPSAKPRQAPVAPTTKPGKELSAEEMLSQMLKPPTAGNRPLSPLPEVASGGADRTSGPGAVAPAAPVVNVMREGTFLVDRVGRLSRGADGGGQSEFVFESDGTALQDPPVVIIPNLKLMQMEDAVANSSRDLRFRISGMVTEYRGRNYVLLEKAVVVPEVLDKF